MGTLSDTYGRRPLLIIGCLGSLVTCLVLGFASKYWVLLAARFIHGLFNGTIGIVKTYMGEMSDKTNRVRTLSYFSMSNALGQIIGNTIGGITARPAISYPKIFSDTIFSGYPYLLPNLIAAILVLINTVMCILFLEENFLPKRQILCCRTPTFSLSKSKNSLKKQIANDIELIPMVNKQPLNETESGVQSSNNDYNSKTDNSNDDHINKIYKNPVPNYSKRGSIFQRFISIWIKWRYPFFICSLYGLYGGFVTGATAAMLPNWLAADKEKGGFGFDTSQIGICLGTNAAGVIINQLFFYFAFVKCCKGYAFFVH